jgi:hypothetical protein
MEAQMNAEQFIKMLQEANVVFSIETWEEFGDFDVIVEKDTEATRFSFDINTRTLKTVEIESSHYS